MGEWDDMLGRGECAPVDWKARAEQADAVLSDLRAAREISSLIDGTYPADLDREAWAWRRVMKVAEEVGEVNEAMLGLLGENPRKGVTHTVEDVRKELLDVALAALGACVHLDPAADPIDDLAAHARRVRDRLSAALRGEEA